MLIKLRRYSLGILDNYPLVEKIYRGQVIKRGRVPSVGWAEPPYHVKVDPFDGGTVLRNLELT